jgi:hypothetical protein
MTVDFLASIARSEYARKVWRQAWNENHAELPDHQTRDEAMISVRRSGDEEAIRWLEDLFPPKCSEIHELTKYDD